MLNGNWTDIGFETVKFAADSIADKATTPMVAVMNFYEELNKKVAIVHDQPESGTVVQNIRREVRYRSRTVGSRVIYWSIEPDQSVMFRGLYSSEQTPLLI